MIVISSTNPFGNRGLPQTLGNVVGIEPLTGKVLWEYKQWECHISVPSAVDAGDNKVLVVGGYELGATMIKVEIEGRWQLWHHRRSSRPKNSVIKQNHPYCTTAHFYAQYGTNNRRDGLVCMSIRWHRSMWKTKRNPDFNKGSMILVDGLILATDGAKSLYLIEPESIGSSGRLPQPSYWEKQARIAKASRRELEVPLRTGRLWHWL